MSLFSIHNFKIFKKILYLFWKNTIPHLNDALLYERQHRVDTSLSQKRKRFSIKKMSNKFKNI